MPRARLRNVWAATLLAVCAPTAVSGDEGLWPLNRLPAERLSSAHGFVPDESWLLRVQRSCVRFRGGGSGAFVSPDGLVMTNHHVGAAAIRHLGDGQHDYLHDGYLARARPDELPCPTLYLHVLEEIHDVTPRVEAAVGPKMTPDQAAAARNTAMTQISTDAAAQSGLHAEIVSLFGGTERHLYLYKRYTDVRLVMAPELAVASFGGDQANFEYPRYGFDVCFFRVYEGGEPATVEHYLHLANRGIRSSELVLVAGHPCCTKRRLTVAHFEFLRDAVVPFQLALCEQREVSLRQFVEQSEEHRRLAQADLLEVQNARKALRAQLETLWDGQLLERTRQAEQELRAAVRADPNLRSAYGEPWQDGAEAIERMVNSYFTYYLLEVHPATFGELFNLARDLVRLSEEQGKPDAQRLAEYRTTEVEAVLARLRSPPPIHRELERLRLADGLTAITRGLSVQHSAVAAALNGASPQVRAAQVIDGTRLDDGELRASILSRGLKAAGATNDPMIALVLAIEPDARSTRNLYESTFMTGLDHAYERLAKLRRERNGEAIYPEATGTLRVSVGTVIGYETDGHAVDPFTTLGDLYDQETRQRGSAEYRLPQRWLERRGRLDAATPLNFVSTADIVGGSSGSPVLDRHGQVVGLVFDGNRESLAWNYQCDDRQGRAVAVDSRAIVEVLRQVYDADGLADELLGKE